MIDFLFDLLGIFLDGGSTGLNTRKIDKNIELLKQQGWFKQIYEDEKYHRLFFKIDTLGLIYKASFE